MSLAQTTEVAILERREASPTHFLVKVESFSLLGKDDGIHKFQTGEFGAGGYKWKLIIYPNEDKTGIDSDYLSLYLVISDTTSLPANWEVNAVFSFFMFDQISCNYLYSLGRTRRFLPMKLEWGISKFMSKKVLKDPSNGLLIDDNCVFGAEVFVVEKSAVFECLGPLKNVLAPYKREWEISNFSTLGDEWTSEHFFARGLNWYVNLTRKTSGCLAIYLNLTDPKGKRVKADFSICIKDQIKDKHIKKKIDDWFSPTPNNSWGWPSFIELATLEDPKNGYIIKDCCLLELELTVHANV